MIPNTNSLPVRGDIARRFVKFGAVAFAVLSIGSPLVQATGLVLDTGTLTIGATGQLNLQDNDLIVRSGTISTIYGYILTGAYTGTNGYWDGPGINSSVAAVEATGVTAIGVLDNANFGFPHFPYDVNYDLVPESHLTPLGNEIFVKYTYYGDADLNGVVDPNADLNQYLAGLGGGGQGWEWGDFDLSGGPTDADADLNQFLFGLAGQGAPLVSQGSGFSAVAQVPEPTAGGMLLIGALGFLARRNPAGASKKRE